jgi:hypothetical protein
LRSATSGRCAPPAQASWAPAATGGGYTPGFLPSVHRR